MTMTIMAMTRIRRRRRTPALGVGEGLIVLGKSGLTEPGRSTRGLRAMFPGGKVEAQLYIKH